MKRMERGKDCYYFFSSMEDFTQHMENIEDYNPFLSSIECESLKTGKGNYNSRMTDNFHEFLTGCRDGIKGGNKDKNLFKTNEYYSKFNTERSICGAPVIPRVLKNHPKAYTRLKKTKKTGFYNIFINVSEYWGIHGDKVQDYRNYLYDKIYTLISNANSVELNIYAKIMSTQTDNSLSMVIKLKPVAYEVNMDRLMFFITNGDVVRRGMFRLLETDPFMYKDCRFAYGRPAKSRDEDIERSLNGILIHNLTSFDGVDSDGNRINEVDEAKKDIEKRLIDTQTN